MKGLGWALMVASAAAVLAGPPSSATAGQAVSPKALYKTLLAGTIPESQLPAGFHSSTTQAFRIGAGPKRHHAVGEVAIDLDDGKNASIVYVVFPTRSDALSNLTDGLKALKTQKGSTRVVKLVASGLPKPFAALRVSGYTSVTFVVGTVGVNAITTGGTPAALELARLGLKHLKDVT